MPDEEAAQPQAVVPDTDREQPIPEGLELRKDGTILVVMGEDRYTLKRPKYGELRELRELIANMDDEALDAVAVAQEKAAELGTLAEDVFGSERAKHEIAVGKVARARRDALEAIRVAGMRRVFELLSNHKLPSEEAEWETWIIDPSTFSRMLLHWQSVPLARGVS